MKWLTRALPAVFMLGCLAAPVAAQVAGHPIEVSGGAGIFGYDTRARLQDSPAYTGSVGFRLTPWSTRCTWGCG